MFLFIDFDEIGFRRSYAKLSFGLVSCYCSFVHVMSIYDGMVCFDLLCGWWVWVRGFVVWWFGAVVGGFEMMT